MNTRPFAHFGILLIALWLALGLAACEFLPQTGTEWAIAGGIFAAIVIGIVWMALKTSKGPPK